jgi:hypothetical protein
MKLSTLVLRFVVGTLLLVAAGDAAAQSYAFGLKGGPNMAFQRWGESNRQALWAHHVAAFIEGAPEGDGGAMYAQAGYHVRGSAFRFQAVSFGSNQFLGQRTDEFRFNNLSLQVGFKNRTDRISSVLYYFLGVRAEYTLNTNLSDYDDFVQAGLIYPIEGFVRKFNYGLSLGGGWEFPFSEFINGVIEISFHPDFSRQYDAPMIPNIFDPFAGVNRTIPERRVINYTAEISLGLRFLRKIIYID